MWLKMPALHILAVDSVTFVLVALDLGQDYSLDLIGLEVVDHLVDHSWDQCLLQVTLLKWTSMDLVVAAEMVQVLGTDLMVGTGSAVGTGSVMVEIVTVVVDTVEIYCTLDCYTRKRVRTQLT